MNKASENQRNDGVPSDYCYSGCKVKELLLRQQSQSQNVVDTAMKPSQIPNRFPPPPPRRSLQFQSPNQCHGQRQCYSMPPHPPPQPPGPQHFRAVGHYTPIKTGNITNQHTLPPPWQYVPQPQQFNLMGPEHSALVPMSPQFLHTPVNNRYNSYSNFTPDIRSQTMFSQSQRDPRLKPTETVTSQQCTNPQGQHQNKVEFTPEMPMIELIKPSPRLLMSGLVKECVPRQPSDSWSPSSSQAPSSVCNRGIFTITNTTTSSQNQAPGRTLPSEKSHTDIINHILQKRRRESSSDDDQAKKQCVQTVGSDERKDDTGHIVSSSSSHKELVLELSPKTTENLLRTESPPSKPLSPIKLVPLKPSGSSSGVKQACIKSMHSNMVFLNSPPKKSELLKAYKESVKKDTSSTLLTSSHKEIAIPPRDHTNSKEAKCLSKVEENKAVDSNCHKTQQKASVGSVSCRKLHRPKKPVIPDDLNDLFTPDPLTYKVNSGHKTLVVRPDEKAKTNISDTSGSTSISSNTENPVTKPCHKEKSSTSALSSNTPNIISTLHSNDIQISMPTVSLKRLQIDELPPSCKNTETKSVMASSETNEKPKAHGTSCTKETDAAAMPKKTSTSPAEQSEDKKSIDEDSLDLEMDLNFDSLDLDATKSSHSSDDEQLVSLQEIMTRNIKPPDTPEKGAFSEPSTPGQTHHKRHNHIVSNKKTGSYKNSLDQMLKEINTSKKAKEMETQLLTACQEDLLRLAEFEKAEEDREEPILPEQQRFIQRFSLMSNAIKEVPPGHVVFNLEKFGRIFDQNTLQLRQCLLSPQKTEQKTLLWSSHAQLKLYINIGLFQEAYSCSPCPFQVTRFLFKMMSVHRERLLSEKILQVLCDIAYAAASQRVNKSNLTFKVWVPTVADLTLVFLNMGVPFVSLFPLESLQPSFSEGDLLQDVYIKSENPSSQEPSTFPEHNCNNIIKYLSYCVRLRPRAYTDGELLLLLTVLGTVALESRLILLLTVNLYPLLFKIVNNIRDWDNMMPKICLALTDLTDDHHNMCHLVQLLPDHSRGKVLRRHLSLSMISKLLDGSCLYKPRHKDIQLCDLRLFLSRMKPSSLLRIVSSSHHNAEVEEDLASLDQQAYYLCYSLLTLVNEVTNFQIFPAHQKEHLLLLCSELERHVKCHIRESEKWLYRTKVKDLVARIYTRWQMLLQRTKPLNGKLYDYWQPLQGDATSSQDIEEIESSQEVAEKDEDKTGAEMEDEEDEVTQTAPKEDTDSSMEETRLTDAAKEVVDEELMKEEAQCDETKREDGELEQLVPNATVDTVKEDEASSTLETSTEDGMLEVDTTQEILKEDMDTDITLDSSMTSNSTEPIQSSPNHFLQHYATQKTHKTQ